MNAPSAILMNQPPFEVRFPDKEAAMKALSAMTKRLPYLQYSVLPFLDGGQPNPKYKEALYALNLIWNK